MPNLLQFDASEIFLDANVFLYELTAHSRWGQSCHQFIKKIEGGAISGFTSSAVIAEVVHKLMLLEACDRFHVQMHEAIDYLKRHFHKIKILNNYRNALEHIYNLPNLTILEITNSIFIQSHTLIRKYQLLSSDAVHAALCQVHNIQHIATNDKDFIRVRTLTVWQP
jgi:hypothetical protein